MGIRSDKSIAYVLAGGYSRWQKGKQRAQLAPPRERLGARTKKT